MLKTRLDNGFKGRILKDSSVDTSQRTRRSFMTRMYVCPTGTPPAMLLPPNVIALFLLISCAALGVTNFPNRFKKGHLNPTIRSFPFPIVLSVGTLYVNMSSTRSLRVITQYRH